MLTCSLVTLHAHRSYGTRSDTSARSITVAAYSEPTGRSTPSAWRTLSIYYM